MHSTEYLIDVERVASDDGFLFVATVFDLPGCMGSGKTHDAAIAAALIAIPEWIAEAKRHGRSVPAPGSSLRRCKNKS